MVFIIYQEGMKDKLVRMDGRVDEQRKRQLMYMFYYIIQNVHLDTTVHNVPIPVHILTMGSAAGSNVTVQKNSMILCSGVHLTAHQVNISTSNFVTIK